jgi:Fur family transcriptional regulator, peroxide stress response regulator
MRIIPKNSEAVLRACGLRLTGPRRVVLDVLRSTESHPTAEWVHRVVRRRLPRVSLGTVYRNLRLLVGEGLVAEIPGPHARFDANLEAHHHFTCVRCRRILDVDGPLAEPQAEALRGRIAARTGLAITHQRIEFFGRCPQCQSAKARLHRPRRAP